MHRSGQEGRGLGGSILLAFFIFCALVLAAGPQRNTAAQSPAPQPTTVMDLPVVMNWQPVIAKNAMHIPFFDTTDDVWAKRYSAMGIFWFGQVTTSDNYIDVRTGYNQTSLYINLAIMDRLLWYGDPPSPDTLLNWDSASLYLTVPATGGNPAQTMRFDAMLSWDGNAAARTNYQAAYRWDGSGWTATSQPFATYSGWQGIIPNDNTEDKGWFVTFEVPYSTLGAKLPLLEDVWQMGIKVNNRNSGTSTTLTTKTWPDNLVPDSPASYGRIAFGIPNYIAPPATNPQTITIRQGNGVTVKDGMVGGSALCGQNLDPWTQWGTQTYPGAIYLNIQNQANLGDWPCFSRYYVTFPIGAIPTGKKIISASLMLHNFGGSDPSQADGSIIQVLRVNQDWDPGTLSWNNSPEATDNYGSSWVPVLPYTTGFPGQNITWDVSRAVADAYGENQGVLRLAMYDADWGMHSGKYFTSSATDDGNAINRPTLTIVYGN